jgi:hypothetical protein
MFSSCSASVSFSNLYKISIPRVEMQRKYEAWRSASEAGEAGHLK